MADPPQPVPERVPALDGLRAVAVLGVFLFHAGVAGAQLGWAGVELFYVLSGFLITGILLDTRERRGYLANFYARRALRILPAYYLVTGLSVVVALAAGGVGGLSSLPFYVIYAQNYYPQIASRFTDGIPLLGHTWTLAVEEQFYWLWPLAVLVVSGRAFRVLLLILLALAPLARLVLLLITANPYATFTSLPGQTDLLAAGALIAVAIRAGLPTRVMARGGALAGLLGAVCLGCLVWRTGLDAFSDPGLWAARPENVLVLSAMASLFGGIVALTVAGSRFLTRPLSIAPLTHLGRISYGLYLYNPFALLVASTIADPGHPAKSYLLGTNFPAHVAGLGLNYFVALISWRYVEVPLLRLKRRFGSEYEAQVRARSDQTLPGVIPLEAR